MTAKVPRKQVKKVEKVDRDKVGTSLSDLARIDLLLNTSPNANFKFTPFLKKIVTK